MPVSRAKRKANNNWDTQNMTVLGCKVRKDKAELFKTACKEAGTTPNAVFTKAMNNFMIEQGITGEIAESNDSPAVSDQEGNA